MEEPLVVLNKKTTAYTVDETVPVKICSFQRENLYTLSLNSGLQMEYSKKTKAKQNEQAFY